jgi:transposase
MSKPKRPIFKPEFRLEVALLVVDIGYSIREAAKAMDVGKSPIDSGVDNLKKSEVAFHLMHLQ